MKLQKKLLALIAAGLLMFGTAACGDDATTDAPTNGATTEPAIDDTMTEPTIEPTPTETSTE